MDAVVLILSDHRGTYIPRDFLTDNYNELAWEYCNAWGLTEENCRNWIHASDPAYEGYWEDWDWILSNAKYTDPKTGDVYILYQDGDLWGLCEEKMTNEEKRNFYFDIDEEDLEDA